LGAFAKKNASEIWFENKKQISKVMPPLSSYKKKNDDQKNHSNIYFIIMYFINHVMCNKTRTNNQRSY